MKYLFSCMVLIFSITFLHAQTLINEQYASSVINFSSEYSNTSYGSAKALGAPNVYPQCGDNSEAWTGSSPDGGREFIELGFASPQLVNTIRIYQTYAPGAIDSVYLRNAGTGVWNKVYTNTAADNGLCPGFPSLLLEITTPTTSYNVDAVRIAVNSVAVPGYNEIDAVSIANFDLIAASYKQYAGGISDFSSEYTPGDPQWDALQATGPPDASQCVDDSRAWASATENGQREYLVLVYGSPSKSNRLRIFQNIAPGAIDTIYLREAVTGIWHTIFVATAAVQNCPLNYILELNFTKTTYKVDAVRIAINSIDVPYWNEIDAVELTCEVPPASKLTAQSGNWSNPSTWVGGAVPGPADSVQIAATHNVALDINTTVDGLFINNNGTLTISNPFTLNIGPTGGASRQAIINGSLVLSNGKLAVNGNILFSASSSLNMTGGTLMEDGNNGTFAGSVSNGLNLVEFTPGMSSFIFTGGTLNIVDPPFGASGNALKSTYAFGVGSTLLFGDGVSITQGSNPNGFGGNTLPAQLGNLNVNTVNPMNRDVVITSPITILNEARVTKGQLQFNAGTTVNGNVVNNDSLKTNGVFLTNGNVTNSGKIVTGDAFTVNGDFSNSAASVFNSNYVTRINNNLFNSGTINSPSNNFSVGFDLTNNTGATFTASAYTSFGRNMVNNGTFNSFWLYFSNHFALGSIAQTIGGTGTFNIYGFDIFNEHPSGVSILRPFGIQFLYFDSGKVFLNNNDLTLDSYSYGKTNSGNYVVINGSGKLVNKNVSSPVLFPIGTSDYTPVTIGTTTGQTFSASVKSSFTNPPLNSSVVNREWNLTNVTGTPVSATVTFQWNAADEDPSFNRALCYVGHYGPTWMSITGYAPASGSNPYTRTATNVAAFSPFAVGSNGAFGGAPLPVTLTSFTAKRSAETVLLKWKTESEINVSHYEVERSSDARTFEKILSKNAAGSLAATTYDVTDANPNKGTNFYRLTEIDRDGKYFYSNIARVDLDKKYTVTISPNPARNKIFIAGGDNFKEIQLVNAAGIVIKKWTKTANANFDITGIPSGMYVVKLISADETQSHKLAIE